MPALDDSPARIVTQAIVDLGHGAEVPATGKPAGDWLVYTEKLPPQQLDRVVAVVNTEGQSDGRHQFDGELFAHFGFHITVRAPTGEEAWQRAERIRVGLAEGATGLLVTVEDNLYQINAVTNLSQAYRVGEELGSARTRYAVTGRLSVGEVTNLSQVAAFGVFAEYDCLQGAAATTLYDVSGSGYHGTLQGPAAFSGANGLTLDGGYVDLPTALLARIQSAVFLVAPGSRGANVIFGSDSVALYLSTASYPQVTNLPIARASGSAAGVNSTPFYGPNVVAWVWDAANGSRVLYDSYRPDLIASSTAFPSGGGNARFGWFGGGAAFNGNLVYAAFSSAVLTDAQVAAIAEVMTAKVEARGGTVGYANPSTTRQLVTEGDSITVGQSATAGWPSLLSLVNPYTIYNFAVSGQSAEQIAGLAERRSVPLHASAAPDNVYVLFAGTNDGVPATAYASLVATAVIAAAAGWTVVVVPMISRTGADAKKNTLNGLITAGTWPTGTVLIPPAAFPDLCPDNSYANTTYFNVDGVHPKDAGQQKLADGIGPYIDAL